MLHLLRGVVSNRSIKRKGNSQGVALLKTERPSALHKRREDECIQKPRIRRGDIFYADLRPNIGCEQGGIRPVIIVQNNVGNTYSPTVIVAAITASRVKTPLPTHIQISKPCGLKYNSTILLEQIRTIDCSRLREYIGSVSKQTMSRVNSALHISFGLPS